MKKHNYKYGDKFRFIGWEGSERTYQRGNIGTVYTLCEYSPNDAKEAQEQGKNISGYKIRMIPEGQKVQVNDLGWYYGGESFYTDDFFNFDGTLLRGWEYLGSDN